jgi:hypothetical protein
VRIKPVGAGAGGVEASAAGLTDGQGALSWTKNTSTETSGAAQVSVEASGRRRTYRYPSHVIPPALDNAKLYALFMPVRIDAFLNGVNVNIMAYGQTGTGKTHTMFGTPGIMGRAGRGEFGSAIVPEYGLCPRAILDIMRRVRALGPNFCLTASSVELSMILGNRDLMAPTAARCVRAQVGGSKDTPGFFNGHRYGVTIDKKTRPPRLYGMREVEVTDEASVLEIFAGLASRCTAGTGMNDSSSRTHCFVWLTLRAFDPATGTVRTSRFQFVDLAGSERIKDAHNTWNYKEAGTEGLTGMLTNYSLMMLSSAVRALVNHRKKGKGKFSFRTYLFDLVLLLSESMTGRALTAVFVCLSQAPANASQSNNALDFGKEFSRLDVKPRQVPTARLMSLQRAAEKQQRAAEAALAGKIPEKFRIIRGAQLLDATQTLRCLAHFGDGERGMGAGARK